MVSPTSIYKLTVVVDNPLFEGFGMVPAPSVLGGASGTRLRDDMSPGLAGESVGGVYVDGHNYKQPRLSQLWKPPKVEGRVHSFQDFPGVSMTLPAFSRRACDALRDLLEPNGELLPLNSAAGEYYFYNITTYVDVIDRERSICDWHPSGNVASSIEYFAFHVEKLDGLSIFRLFEAFTFTLVTDQFVDRVHAEGLNGFHFTKIWPFPPGVNWTKESIRQEKQEWPTTGKLQHQHTLVVRLPLTGKKPTAAEKKKIAALENELDAQLMVPSLDAPYFGSYWESDVADNEFRMFISSPDVNALVRKLFPWLQSLGWSREVWIMKRFGEIRDVEAPEEIVNLDQWP